MAFSITIFKKDKLLVKELKACEQMGHITEICTEKTATLTKNDMTVSRIYLGDEMMIMREKEALTTSHLDHSVFTLL